MKNPLHHDLHKEFVESNDKFIADNARLSLEEVKMPKGRDRFIEENIQTKVDVAENFGLTQFDNEYYRNQIKIKAREMVENKNPLLGTRQIQNKGGILASDVERYGYEEGGETHTMPDGTVMPGATHEDYEMMMNEPASLPEEQEQDIIPDNEMEDEYLDFILDEALDEEEEDFLMNILQGNERLSIIFDKVVDVAQEFAGSGPVEGPGSGVSDSIPARLSDGEFVFTAKAVDEIGADNLMAMMKDAEMKADDRQGLAEGGQPEEEETVEMEVEKPASKQDIRVVKTTVDNGGKGLLDEDEISKSIKSKMMLDNRTGRHVQS